MLKKLTLAILGTLCIAGCGNTAPRTTAESPAVQQPAEQATVTWFHVNLYDRSGAPLITFDAKDTPNGIILKTWMKDDKRGLITRRADDRLLRQIDSLIQKYNARTWNGQSTNTTEGEGYDIVVRYSNNRNISVSRFGATPLPGIEAFWQDIYKLREESLEQYKEKIDR